MAFRILNETDSIEGPPNRFPQAEPDAVDIDILVQALNNEGVLSGCAVTPKSPESTSVAVALGQVRIGGVDVTVTAGDVDCGMAHPTLRRFDLIAVANTGSKSVVNGVGANYPVFPSVPSNSVILAAVWRAAADDTIAAADIVDKRCIVQRPGGTLDDAYDYGGAGAGRTIYVATALPVRFLADLATGYVWEMYSPAAHTGYAFRLRATGTFEWGPGDGTSDTQMYRVFAGRLGSSVLHLVLAAGTVGAPTYSFAVDPDTGLYRPAADAIGFVSAGVEMWRLLASGAFAAQGANRALQNVLDPVNDQDAATKIWAVGQVSTHAALPNVHHAQAHEVDGHDAATPLSVAKGGTGLAAAGSAPAPNTTPSPPSTLQSQWAAVTGDARKVLAVTAAGVLGWVSLAPYDIKSPAQILTFVITSDGVGDDAMVSAQKLWGSNAGTWDAAMTYEGIPEAPTTVSESTGDADYPHTVTTPFTSASNMGAINSPAAVNGTIVFTLNATVDGVAVTKTYTVTYRNRRHWGVGGATIDSAGINALASEELTNTEVKSQWNDTLAAQYEWYCYPSRLGTATMWSGGFEGGFEAPTTVSHTNDKGKTEDYYCYRSSNPLTGTYSFEAKA